MTNDLLERLRQALSGRYSIQFEIERGGMATVYLAEDVRHGRRVAIKVLRSGLAAGGGNERFLREIDVVAKLQHPHILTLIDSGEIDGLPYYVMPFVEGQSLKEYLARKGPLPLDEAVRLAAEICDGLEAAHSRGVIHRDVKPGNVLLSGGHAVVADFGIAAAVDQVRETRLTDTGVSLGSPAYMSPEQASGEAELDQRVDVYGVGCILYEMLAGEPPFEGSAKTLLTRKILGDVRPLEELRTDVPDALGRIVSRALETDPAARFETAGELRDALRVALPAPQAAGAARRWAVGGVGVAVLVAVIGVVAVWGVRQAGERALWASEQLATVEQFVDAGEYSEALVLAKEVQDVFPDDERVARLLPRFSFTVPVRSSPPGARVFAQRMDEPGEVWEDLGVTPIEEARFAGFTMESEGGGTYHEPHRPWRLRFELDGFETREILVHALTGADWRGFPPIEVVELQAVGSETAGMVPVPGFTYLGRDVSAYYLDRHEVTNADFQDFVDAGGYEDRRYWDHPFVRDGVEIPFEDAVALFRDQTGRTGPSTWRLGTYPDGQGDHPVGGVSWYEAAAYARWAGKELPTASDWAGGLMYYRESSYATVPGSNLGSSGPRPVAEGGRSLTALGMYDVVGNVREWCYNEVVGEGRATRGAAWSDAPEHATGIIPHSAFDRDATLGFRLARTSRDDEAQRSLREPIPRFDPRDYAAETPASDAEFEVIRRLYEYDPVPLNARVERTDSAEHWVRQVVTFDVPYGDRGGAAIYLPHGYERPLQAVVYVGGSYINVLRSVDEDFLQAFDFLVRSGRAVITPLLAGTYGRPRPGEPAGTITPDPPMPSRAYRDLTIQRVKDVRGTIDYLETRDDVTTDSLGFFGFSFGGGWAANFLAVEPRFDVAVLNVGGLPAPPLQPEIDRLNFVTRVTVPTLMINGEHDTVFPLETSARPMFEMLGTPPEHKRHHLVPAAHFVPIDVLVRETLGWFDAYMGTPTRE